MGQKVRTEKVKDPVAVAQAVDAYFARQFPGQLPLSYYELALIVRQQTGLDFRAASDAVLEARPEAEWKLREVKTL